MAALPTTARAAVNKLKQYGWNNAIAFDRQVNALLGGDPEMTLSGRMGRALAARHCLLCRFICAALDLIDPGHCTRTGAEEASEGSDAVVK